MHIHCKIFSTNILLHYKLNGFIKRTRYLLLSEEKDEKIHDEIIFWDSDSICIDTLYLKNYINGGSIVIMVSSLFPKDTILNSFEENQRRKIGVLSKSMQYANFVEEISRLIDILNL